MGGDIKGGGFTIYESNPQQNSNLVFSEGLRVPRVRASLELDGVAGTAVMAKSKSFDRGIILHLRSNATQYVTFHSMFGGFKKSVIDRYFMNFLWKVMIKRAGPVYAVMWTLQVISHRDYDNNAYCYFYFSD